MTRFPANSSSGQTEPAVLSIGEVAERTGMTVAGLRNWEGRYGIPSPRRSAGGQRRYLESDCDLIIDVLSRRARGVALRSAIQQAKEAARSVHETSIYAAVRRRRPELTVHRMDKRMLLGLTRAVEDQCCADAGRPVLVGAFQEQRFYRSSRRRWESMASTSEQTIVFVDHVRPGAGGRVAAVPIPPTSPMQREWSMICDSRDLPACVLGWEPPGQEDARDATRVFEVLWSVDPQVVRLAARVAVEIASRTVPALQDDLAGRLAEEAPPASPDLQRAAALLGRTLDYMAR